MKRSAVNFRLVTTILLISSAIAFSATIAVAGSCLHDEREVKIDTVNAIKLRELRCRLDRDPSVSIGVQFQRLNEHAAGVLLNKGKAPWFESLYPKTRLVENDVLREYRNLISKFGTAKRVKEEGEGGYFAVNVQGATQPELKAAPKGAKKEPLKVMQSFELPTLSDAPLVDELLHILNEPTFSGTLQFQYGAVEPDIDPRRMFDASHVWRYLTRADLVAYNANVSRLNKLLKMPASRNLPSNNRAIPLYLYLTAKGWPEHFLPATAPLSGDGCIALSFHVPSYNPIVEIALIQNRSEKSIALNRLLGTATTALTLRELENHRGPSASGAIIDERERVLKPGESVIVPLQLSFRRYGAVEERSPETEKFEAETQHQSEAFYERIRATPPGTVFTMIVNTDIRNKQKRGNAPNTYEIRKTRESFKPHSKPIEKDYVFGPEWTLAGLEVGGERVNFAKTEPDFIQLSAGGEMGSCPVLYAWSGDAKRYERHGKIIHKAATRAKKQTETISFDGWVPRFLIAEEELELARLDAVRAVIRLSDGTLRDLAPTRADLARIDDRTLDLYAGEEVELAFTLPASVAAKDVVETRLVVTGHYDRYSDLLAHLAIQSQLIKASARGK